MSKSVNHSRRTISGSEPTAGLGPTADQVAAVIAGSAGVSAACRALEGAGWRSSAAGNRVMVNDRVFARFIAGNGSGQPGPVDDTWLVYGIGDQPLVRIVTA